VAELQLEAAVLVNISNDAWFGNSIGSYQHFQMARMRATNTGMTDAVDYKVRVMNQLPPYQTGTLTSTGVRRTGATPYVRWLDWPVIAASISVVGLV
tara:strand:+ start:2252 stop:2542 length:291 start_codon:yes stop_codon:yes gene_type:complete